MEINKELFNVVNDSENKFNYITFAKFEKYNDKIKCLYSLKDYNVDFSRVFHPSYDENVLNESYRKLEASTGIKKENVVLPVQTHTDNVRVIDENSTIGKITEGFEEYQDVDSLITNRKGIYLGLTYADCTPILMYDPVKEVIANVHSGWKGTFQEIGKKTVEKMIETYGCDAKDIIVVIGPCIMKDHFEVKEDLKIKFEEKFNKYDKDEYIFEKGIDAEGNMKYLIDTSYINIKSLESIGIKEENISDCEICTMCNKDIMHSYRYDNNAGRNIALIGLI